MVVADGQLWCNVCEVGFLWKSRYERHLVSAKHRQMASMLGSAGELMEIEHGESLQVETPALEVHIV